MKLNFPDPSRSFDATGNRVRFWGYDSAIDVSFFVEADALRKLCPEMSNVEAGLLEAFDAARKRICEVGDKVYVAAKVASLTYWQRRIFEDVWCIGAEGREGWVAMLHLGCRGAWRRGHPGLVSATLEPEQKG